jgi:hypothetical protein
MIIPVPQGDVEASAEADLLNNAPRKTRMYTKARQDPIGTNGGSRPRRDEVRS